MLPKPPPVHSQNVLLRVTEFHTALALTRYILWPKNWDNGLMHGEFTDLTMLFTIQNQPCWWERRMVFWRHIIAPARGQSLQGWAKVLQKLYMYRISDHSMALCLPQPGIKVRNGNGTIVPGDSLADFLLLVPITLCSAGVEVFVLGGGRLVPGSTTMTSLN